MRFSPLHVPLLRKMEARRFDARGGMSCTLCCFPPPRDTGVPHLRKRTLLGPYRRLMPRVIGGWAFSYGRGTPVPKWNAARPTRGLAGATSRIRKRPPLGPYSRPMHSPLGGGHFLMSENTVLLALRRMPAWNVHSTRQAARHTAGVIM